MAEKHRSKKKTSQDDFGQFTKLKKRTNFVAESFFAKDCFSEKIAATEKWAEKFSGFWGFLGWTVAAVISWK